MAVWKAGVDGADDGAGVAEVGHGFVEFVEFCQQGGVGLAVELDDEEAVGFAVHHLVDGGAVDRDAAAEVDHGAVDQLDGFGRQGDQVFRGFHGGAEGGELADAEHLAGEDGLQVQLDCGGEGEGAFGADQEAGEVLAAFAAGPGGQDLDVVAADAAELLGEAGGDLIGFAGAEGAELLDEGGDAGGDVGAEVAGEGAEDVPGSVGKDGVDGADIVGHQAVADGFGAAGVVGRHAADGAAGVGAGIDGEEEFLGFEGGVEVAEDEAGFDPGAAGCSVDFDDAAEVLGAVDHQGAVDGLAALAGAAAAGEDWDAVFAGDGDRGGDVVDRAGDDHADGFDLVDGGVGAVAAAVGAAEQHLCLRLLAQALRQAGVA